MNNQLNPYQDILDGLRNADLQLSFYHHTIPIDQIISWLAIIGIAWIAWSVAKQIVKY